jgi:MFS family permease
MLIDFQEAFCAQWFWVRAPNFQTHSYCGISDLASRYCVDSLLLLLQSIIATPAGYEFNPSYPHALTIAVYVGMLLGALFWGMSADVIGRRFAFNVSLFLCSAFTIIAGAAPNWTSLAVFIALLGFGGGGNLIMDTTVFIEYLPSHKQWVLSTHIEVTYETFD